MNREENPMTTTRTIARITAVVAGTAVVAAAIILGAGLADAGCQHVTAGADECTVCERYYMIDDDICYENYYYCVNSETGAIDGYFNDRCEPF